MLSRLVLVSFTMLLVVGVPTLSWVTTRSGQIRHIPRRSLYLSAAISQWSLAGLGILVVLFTSHNVLATGFRAISPLIAVRWAILLAAVALTSLGVILLLQHHGWCPAESELVYLLIPETRHEKVWSVLVLAPTAALCEEFLYRGYLLAQLVQRFHSISWAWAASSLAFGLAHTYQGWSGALRAALLGALLAYPVIRLGSLYPSMLAHGLIDAVALAWLGPRFLRKRHE